MEKPTNTAPQSAYVPLAARASERLLGALLDRLAGPRASLAQRTLHFADRVLGAFWSVVGEGGLPVGFAPRPLEPASWILPEPWDDEGAAAPVARRRVRAQAERPQQPAVVPSQPDAMPSAPPLQAAVIVPAQPVQAPGAAERGAAISLPQVTADRPPRDTAGISPQNQAGGPARAAAPGTVAASAAAPPATATVANLPAAAEPAAPSISLQQQGTRPSSPIHMGMPAEAPALAPAVPAATALAASAPAVVTTPIIGTVNSLDGPAPATPAAEPGPAREVPATPGPALAAAPALMTPQEAAQRTDPASVPSFTPGAAPSPVAQTAPSLGPAVAAPASLMATPESDEGSPLPPARSEAQALAAAPEERAIDVVGAPAERLLRPAPRPSAFARALGHLQWVDERASGRTRAAEENREIPVGETASRDLQAAEPRGAELPMLLPAADEVPGAAQGRRRPEVPLPGRFRETAAAALPSAVPPLSITAPPEPVSPAEGTPAPAAPVVPLVAPTVSAVSAPAAAQALAPAAASQAMDAPSEATTPAPGAELGLPGGAGLAPLPGPGRSAAGEAAVAPTGSGQPSPVLDMAPAERPPLAMPLVQPEPELLARPAAEGRSRAQETVAPPAPVAASQPAVKSQVPLAPGVESPVTQATAAEAAPVVAAHVPGSAPSPGAGAAPLSPAAPEPVRVAAAPGEAVLETASTTIPRGAAEPRGAVATPRTAPVAVGQAAPPSEASPVPLAAPLPAARAEARPLAIESRERPLGLPGPGRAQAAVAARERAEAEVRPLGLPVGGLPPAAPPPAAPFIERLWRLAERFVGNLAGWQASQDSQPLPVASHRPWAEPQTWQEWLHPAAAPAASQAQPVRRPAPSIGAPSMDMTRLGLSPLQARAVREEQAADVPQPVAADRLPAAMPLLSGPPEAPRAAAEGATPPFRGRPGSGAPAPGDAMAPGIAPVVEPGATLITAGAGQPGMSPAPAAEARRAEPPALTAEQPAGVAALSSPPQEAPAIAAPPAAEAVTPPGARPDIQVPPGAAEALRQAPAPFAETVATQQVSVRPGGIGSLSEYFGTLVGTRAAGLVAEFIEPQVVIALSGGALSPAQAAMRSGGLGKAPRLLVPLLRQLFSLNASPGAAEPVFTPATPGGAPTGGGLAEAAEAMSGLLGTYPTPPPEDDQAPGPEGSRLPGRLGARRPARPGMPLADEFTASPAAPAGAAPMARDTGPAMIAQAPAPFAAPASAQAALAMVRQVLGQGTARLSGLGGVAGLADAAASLSWPMLRLFPEAARMFLGGPLSDRAPGAPAVPGELPPRWAELLGLRPLIELGGLADEGGAPPTSAAPRRRPGAMPKALAPGEEQAGSLSADRTTPLPQSFGGGADAWLRSLALFGLFGQGEAAAANTLGAGEAGWLAGLLPLLATTEGEGRAEATGEGPAPRRPRAPAAASPFAVRLPQAAARSDELASSIVLSLLQAGWQPPAAVRAALSATAASDKGVPAWGAMDPVELEVISRSFAEPDDDHPARAFETEPAPPRPRQRPELSVLQGGRRDGERPVVPPAPAAPSWQRSVPEATLVAPALLAPRPAAPAADPSAKLLDAIRSHATAQAAASDDRVTLGDLTLIAVAAGKEQVAAASTANAPASVANDDVVAGQPLKGETKEDRIKMQREVEHLVNQVLDEILFFGRIDDERYGEQ